MKTVICYSPGKSFPSVSLTGGHCELGCPHCMGRPLSAMLPAQTPEKLCEIAAGLAGRGALGFLLSGGCSSESVVDLEPYLEAIKSIKRGTNLKINAHIGFPRAGSVRRIVSSGIDAFSLTYPTSDRVGKEFLMTEGAVGRYDETVKALVGEGAGKVVPHILLGIGTPEEDARAVENISTEPPASLVVIAFRPIRGTPFEVANATPDSRIIAPIELARELMPDTKIVLGCMRPRGRVEMEKYLVENLLDGIAMPSGGLARSLSSSISLERVPGCCAVYL